MDFLDNVVKSSNALLKDKLNNPFAKQQQTSKDGQDHQQQSTATQANPSSSSSVPTTTNTSSEETTSRTAAAAAATDSQNADANSQFAAIAADAEAVTQKAVKGAKDFGNFLFSMANKAGQTVSQTAKQVKQAVENTSILTDFTKEQQEFIKEHGGSMQAGELPWLNCADESKATEIREQVLTLSQDKRNFVRSPPNDANFEFDSKQCYPIALSLLREDPNLSKMRFELVPKLVNEDTFWRNYFYRVSLLKQMSERGEEMKKQGWTSSRSSSGEGPDVENNEEAANQESFTNYNANEAISTTNNNSYVTTNNTVADNTSNFKDYSDYNFEPSSNTTSKEEANDLIEQELESSKLFAEADLKNRLKELNIGSLDESGNQDG